jgi:hypothetical protein
MSADVSAECTACIFRVEEKAKQVDRRLLLLA